MAFAGSFLSQSTKFQLNILCNPRRKIPPARSSRRKMMLTAMASRMDLPRLAEAAKLTIDFSFDDADIIEEGTLNAVIGLQTLQDGESILQEKSIVKAACNRAFIVTEEQYTRDLHGSIPVLVNSVNWMETAEEIDDLFLGDAEVWRRPTIGHAGPTGGDFPLVTSEGHNVLDVIFTSPILDLAQVAESLDRIEGVVDHGVIFGIPCTAVLVSKDGLRIVDNLLKDAIM
ncbi:hypothetical protein MRB53_018781 [Persea americana]|uniref:Uncharacterized protein n=1 Tax=Persea americana TaxID=3435 RepID=A0ACC2M8E9_PERAE|nr:hypothetical protein MRB53_018781 [Persea americana]